MEVPADVAAAREKLQARFAAVRTGGAGTARRKKLSKHTSHAADDKQLQAQLKKLGVNNIPGIEEVNIFPEHVDFLDTRDIVHTKLFQLSLELFVVGSM